LWVIPLALYLLTFILVFTRGWTATLPGQHATSKESAPGYSPHWFILYLAGPLGIVALAVIWVRGAGFGPVWTTFFLMLFFFLITLACHGELARDRPSTQYLTEFYLLMSVGGMVGGIFNGIVAPLVFPGVWEFPIAIVIAAAVRPMLMELGWLDQT